MFSGSSSALDRLAGVYVEAIHTDGGVLGLFDPSGHADFYPNGGSHPMSGCLINTCSHSRSYEYFASTVRTNHLIGTLCNNMFELENNQCSGNGFQMGNSIISKRG